MGFGSERDLFKSCRVPVGILSRVRLVSANLFLAGYVKRLSGFLFPLALSGAGSEIRGVNGPSHPPPPLPSPLCPNYIPSHLTSFMNFKCSSPNHRSLLPLSDVIRPWHTHAGQNSLRISDVPLHAFPSCKYGFNVL